jgi:hypothetical protein
LVFSTEALPAADAGEAYEPRRTALTGKKDV